MVLEWSVFALADREAIFDYIEADSPRAAVSADDRIKQCVENLKRFPEMGGQAASKERASWSSPAHRTSPLIALPATLCGYCVYCTAHSSGRTICLTSGNRASWPLGTASEMRIPGI